MEKWYIMKKNSNIWLFISAIVIMIILSSGNVCQAKGMAPALKVQGTNIVNNKGKKITLKGVSTHGIAWFPQYVNKNCFK